MMKENRFIGPVKRTILGKVAACQLLRISYDFLPIENAG
jgi:hypothetical protein